ncbi:Rod binding domain-containing protein [Sphingomonas sp. BE123]|uniref:rod-binding protein n=1 Tax=Sphingomonas sp. BE123 TaxID=2817842 RepID=UPI0028556AC2|nr:rod-binding protein [Sphingomonas sp. BE123]MDR6852534.1 Rod binding domain-containing protein [Sphingomonas sp. BE123]
MAQPNLTGSVSTDTARLGTRDNLDQAGEKFEAIFTRMMLSSMRKAKLADSLFESQALGQFRDMQDQKLAENMAAHTPMGIGKAMTEFLAKAGSGEGNPPPQGGGGARSATEGEEAPTSVLASSPSVSLRLTPPPGGGGLKLQGEPE